MTGIDISKYQLAIPPGDWDFVIVRVTHDAGGTDALAAQHFADAARRAPVRGVYHFWDPTASSGVAQAQLMASNALKIGFRKGVDLWALDSEAVALPTPAANIAWKRAFYATARSMLGNKCLWYVGWPFYVEHFGNDLAALKEQAWWLPAYGPNDGTPHDPQCPYAPALHQYTSVGGPNRSGLDVNRVMDAGAWNALLVPVAPAHPPAPKVTPVIQATHPPVDVKVIDGHPIVLTSDGGIFAPEGGFCGTPVGQTYWKGQTAAALATKGDPKHPLSDAEVKAGKSYAVIAESGSRYAYGLKN